MKKYFDKYVSNTLASTMNQTCLYTSGEKQKSRVYVKVFSGGEYEYSLLFTDTIDSTYGDGSSTVANEVCGEWTIHSAKIIIPNGDYLSELKNETEPKSTVQLTFDGKISRTVKEGESFNTDSVLLNLEKNETIAVEIEFSGRKIPYFEEILVPTYLFINGEWVLDKRVVAPSMIGVARKVEKRIGFFGDSITEGIGTQMGEYSHWCAEIARTLGEKYSYWNLGIGFARAYDGASNGAWLEKAKKLDLVTICLGVNDIGSGCTADEIKASLRKIVEILSQNGVRTVLFTIPPFDYCEKTELIWREVNAYILDEMSAITEVYDVVPIWGDKAPNEHRAVYGGHPNEEGCLKLAKDFVSKIQL
ncbi:MAG: SGNH/GDSL hydrolase family protein [Clostridia bacterium]|nr:SGNH/GDSL hydrolase family protein [Clostridia bacterium]